MWTGSLLLMGPHEHIPGWDETFFVNSGSNYKKKKKCGMAHLIFHPMFMPWSCTWGQPWETEVSETLVQAGDTLSHMRNAVGNLSKS